MCACELWLPMAQPHKNASTDKNGSSFSVLFFASVAHRFWNVIRCENVYIDHEQMKMLFYICRCVRTSATQRRPDICFECRCSCGMCSMFAAFHSYVRSNWNNHNNGTKLNIASEKWWKKMRLILFIWLTLFRWQFVRQYMNCVMSCESANQRLLKIYSLSARHTTDISFSSFDTRHNNNTTRN